MVKPKGWADVVTSGASREAGVVEAPPEPALQRKTYILRPGMVKEIAELAEQERVQVNDLVRFLLNYAIEDLKSGKLQLHTTSEVRRIAT